MLYPSTVGNTPPTTKITPHGQSAICATSSPDGRARPHDSCAHARSVGGGATFRFVIRKADFINYIIPSIFFFFSAESLIL